MSRKPPFICEDCKGIIPWPDDRILVETQYRNEAKTRAWHTRVVARICKPCMGKREADRQQSSLLTDEGEPWGGKRGTDTGAEGRHPGPAAYHDPGAGG